MSIAELGSLGEFVGSLGVIVTLVYLAVQIRANTRATKASAGFEATHSWAQLNEHVGLSTDELVQPFVGIYEDDFDPSQLTDAQYLRLTLLIRAIFQKLEGQYYLHKYGLLDPGLWEQRSAVCRGMIEVPHLARWWEQEKEARTFSTEFEAALERSDAIQASVINRRL